MCPYTAERPEYRQNSKQNVALTYDIPSVPLGWKKLSVYLVGLSAMPKEAASASRSVTRILCLEECAQPRRQARRRRSSSSPSGAGFRPPDPPSNRSSYSGPQHSSLFDGGTGISVSLPAPSTTTRTTRSAPCHAFIYYSDAGRIIYSCLLNFPGLWCVYPPRVHKRLVYICI
jgi:hypothetical protein